MAENIPPQKREVVVSGDRNCFYRAVSLWKDEISDEKQKKIPRSSDNLSRKIQRFLGSHFSPPTLWRILSGTAKCGHMCIAPQATHLYLLIVA